MHLQSRATFMHVGKSVWMCLHIISLALSRFRNFPYIHVRAVNYNKRPINAPFALAQRRAPLWMQQLWMAASLQGSKAMLGCWTVWCQREKHEKGEWTTAFNKHLSTQGFLTSSWRINRCEKDQKEQPHPRHMSSYVRVLRMQEALEFLFISSKRI